LTNSALKPNPFCGTAGCFAGLISIVANDVPELKELYAGEKYCFTEWAEALKKLVPQNGFGFKALFIATSLFLISSGNASNASTNILKFFVFILSIIFLPKQRLFEGENDE
jgi:hypothetical protein